MKDFLETGLVIVILISGLVFSVAALLSFFWFMPDAPTQCADYRDYIVRDIPARCLAEYQE